MAKDARNSLARNLGAFIGHVWRGFTADVSREKHVLRKEILEDSRPGPEGRITLRRTTIEEVEVERPPSAQPPDLGARG